jgi:hypothetical protein
MNEIEFDKILDMQLVKTTAAHVKPFAKHGGVIMPIRTFVEDVGTNRSDTALAIWIAVNIRVFVHARGSAHGPMVEKIWKFAGGDTDIDIRAGFNGGNHFFKIMTGMSTGKTSFWLRIYSWDHGKKVCDWERYGSYRGTKDYAGIETLPVN